MSSPDDLTPQYQAFGQAREFRGELETKRNSFGLFRRYFSHQFPSHDPDSEVDLEHLSLSERESDHPAVTSYIPYPNKSSFLLGEWYWNNGVKSQKDLKDLVNIICGTDFRPADIKSINWGKIDAALSRDADGINDGEWVDERIGWTTSSITISVPFHRLTRTPGTQTFAVTNFHHRSLVSVIREKLADPNSAPHFHYEPYELLWQISDAQDPIRIHGELYTSPAFIDAHEKLQESPGEPGCNLPRVIVALMFWSDSTVLTNFGKAKLWPLYLYFGNESKYRRAKPSHKLCSHVAYFEAVCET
jgi:Plavaka transposase